MKLSTTIIAFPLFFAMGCASDLESENDTRVDPTPQNAGEITIDARGGGVGPMGPSEITEEHWTYLSLSEGTLVEVEDRKTDKQWDLGFQRYHIRANGGITGPRGVSVAIAEAGYDSITATAGDLVWHEDKAEGDDPQNFFNNTGLALLTVAGGWFDMTHGAMGTTIVPRTRTYVLRTQAEYYKIQFLDYYDEAGTSGYVKLRFARIAPPPIE